MEGAAEIPTLKMNQLQQCAKASVDDDKYFFIFDKNGNVGSFYNYSASVLDVHKMALNVQMGNSTMAEA